MHRLLRRQLLKRGYDPDALEGAVAELAADINATYWQAEEDREMLEHSVELSSAELRHVNEEMTALFHASPDVFLRLDQHGVVLERHGGRMLRRRFARTPAPGDLLAEHLPDRAARALDSAFARVSSGEGTATIHAAFEENEVFEVRLMPLAGNQVMAVLRDVTERERSQNIVGEQNREHARLEALSQFAYIASHDLRQPLRAIQNLAQWLQEDLGESLTGTSREHLQLLRSRVQRMDMLLSGLLEYSRVGRKEAKIESVDVGQVLAAVIEMLSPPEGFSVKATTPLPCFDTARNPLERVLLNLIGNAIKHHDRAGGVVQVSCEDADTWFRFTVRDDGPGIPVPFRDRAFQMFQKLKRRDDVEGSGMGLALIKRIVESTGGQVTLTDNTPRGALFRFTWPKNWAEHARDSYRPEEY